MSSKRFIRPIIMSGKDYDMSKQWYVFFRYTCPTTNETVQKKITNSYNRIKDKGERVKHFKALREAVEDMLMAGWNPITHPDFKERPQKESNLSFTSVTAMPIPKAVKFALEKKVLASKSRYDYKTTVKYVSEACEELQYGGLPISELKRIHVKTIIDKVRELKKLSNKGYNKHLTQFKSLLSELVEWEAIEHNPAFRLKNLPEEQTNKFVTLTDEERCVLREYLIVKNKAFFRFCMAIYHTGIRPKELLSLQLKDVDLKNSTIHLQPYNEKTKTKKERLVAINNQMKTLFEEIINPGQPSNYYLFGEHFLPALLPTNRRTATDLWHKLIIEELGIEKYLYSLKHLGADDLIEAGADEEAVRDHLGHSSKFMTRRYSNKGKEKSREKILSLSNTF